MITNDHPYRVSIKGVPEAYTDGDRVNLTDVMNNNRRWNQDGRKSLLAYRDNLEFRFSKALALDGYGNMSGIGPVLFAMKPDATIDHPTLQALLISYFGNGAKKKLAEFKTAGELLTWITNNPLEVLEAMNVDLPPVREVPKATEPVATEPVPAPRKKKATPAAISPEAINVITAGTTANGETHWTTTAYRTVLDDIAAATQVAQNNAYFTRTDTDPVADLAAILATNGATATATVPAT